MSGRTTVSFSDEELKFIKELQEAMGARSITEVVRRSVVQAAALRRQADSDGNIKVEKPDGEKVIYPMKW